MSTFIPPSTFKDAYFGDLPDFPSIFGAEPNTNSIYHNKRVNTINHKRLNTHTREEITERVWQIPFAADQSISLTQITLRIDRALDKLGLYTYWRICYNDHIITATEHIKVPTMSLDISR